MSIASDRPDSSPDLCRRARAGDDAAFSLLAEAHEPRLFRQAVALCRNLAVAEDLAAETLIEAWRSIRRYDAQCRFSTWLYAILLHRYHKLLRRRRRWPVALSALPAREARGSEAVLDRIPDRQPLAPEAIMEDESCRSLRNAVERLPAKHREVLFLRFYEEASLAEIAAALKLSVGTVKSRLHHALAKLRRMQLPVNLSPSSEDTRA